MHIDKHEKTIFEWRFTPMANYICPTFKVTRSESNTPRGLALILFLIRNKKRNFNSVSVEKLYQCSTCYLCSSLSYDESDPASLFIAARADIVDKGLAPGVVHDLKNKITNFNSDHIINFEIFKKKSDIGLFIDPLTLEDSNDELEANLKLLEKAKVDFTVFGTKKGSGAQLFEIGFRDRAKEIADMNLKEIILSEIKKLIFLSPYDFRAFSQWYQEMGIKVPENIELIPYPKFILNLIKENKLKFRDGKNETVTYHDSGNYSRIENGFLEINEILSHIPNIQYIPMLKSGVKAGCDGGDFLHYIYPDIQSSITRKRLDEAIETGAKILLTSCFYAKNNFTRELKSNLDVANLEVIDLGKFLLKHLIQ